MDILQIFNEKFKELGEESVCQALELPKHIVRQFGTGKKTPSYKTCQKIVDLWGNGHSKEADKELSDGSISALEYDKEGILNGSYCPAEWGLKKKAWEGRDVCLCLPVYSDVPQAHFFCLLAMAMKYRMAIRLELRGDDSMITRSRNHLAKRFLDSGASWSIWFDSDMVLPFGHAGAYGTMTNMLKTVGQEFLGIHTIERLISRGRTVVGGLYWDRRGGGRLIAGGGPAMTSPIPSNTLHPVNFCGTGCLAVHRQVFLDIAAKFPETLSPDSLGNECGFFTNIQLPERMMGEDESFAKRATDAGHPTFLDLGLLCGHLGSGNIHAMPAFGSKI